MKINNSIPYIIIVSILTMDIIIYAGLTKMFFSSDTTIIAGVIGFLGAIIGGAITLIGVRMTIEHNEKLRMKNDLPDKLLHIENAVHLLEKIIENDLDFISYGPYDIKPNFITTDRNLKVVHSDIYDKFIDQVPGKLKNELVYIDAETYKMYLNFKNQIWLLKPRIFTETEIKLMDYRNNLIARLIDFREEYEILLDEIILDRDSQDELFTLKNIFIKKDQEFTYELKQIYNDLLIQLLLKHEQLIEELDY